MNLPDMPEAVFRRVWQQQSFSTEHLKTSDGRAVAILSAGTQNTDGGPDFLNAKISIGKTIFHGDVELHINAGEWLSHKHDADPHYNKVILHVVLTADPLSPPARTASRRAIPLLVLHPFLDERFHTAWVKALADDQTGSIHSLACVELNDEVPTNIITRWLERLATERIELKVRRFEERVKQLIDETRHIVREPYPRYYGNPAEIPYPKHAYAKKDFADKSLWEQLLYEGIMEGLGYSKNTKPFLALARSMRLRILRQHTLDDSATMTGLLFGAAGLLPSGREVESKESRLYVSILRAIWKSYQPEFKGQLLNEADWLFFRLRPSNFPTARLAAMSFMLPTIFGDDSLRTLMKIFKDQSLSSKERIASLHSLFSCQPDEFWRHHFRLKGKAKTKKRSSDEEESLQRLPSGQAGTKAGIALGSARIGDILVNVVVPIVLLYGRIFKDAAISKHTRALLSALPASQENSITQIIQQQLMKEKKKLSSAQLQQGSIQLYRFYCSPVRCAECAVGRNTTLASAQGNS
jgi:hypothetical protein